jgi:lysophospholipase L1-like esterase
VGAKTRAKVKRLALAAAYGGGGMGAAGALFYGLILGQALIARRTIPIAMSPAPRADGLYGREHSGEPLRLVVLGDSAAAGFGVATGRETFGAVIAAELAVHLRRPVHLRVHAVVGAQSVGLPPQVERALEHPVDIAVICIGGNDVTSRTSVRKAVGYLVDSVHRLREVGAEVVVGTCPDLGTIRPIQPPLRWLARHWSRQMAAAQTIAAVGAGARTVSLGDLIGPTFYRDPERMFSYDRFHPSAAGYAAAAEAVLPTVYAALTPPEQETPMTSGEGVRTLPQAAVEAVHTAGTEVSAASVAGLEHGPDGRWAQLRHRVWRRSRQPIPSPAQPSTVEAQA